MIKNAVYAFCCDSPLGKILIKADNSAVTYLSFCEETAKTIPLEDCPEVIKTVVKELGLYFDGKLKRFSVKVWQEAPPFRMKVLSEMAEIPYGQTISYGELAARAGSPKAARAAGSACHNNNIAIIVPCHRVVGASGALTGYAGGIERKKYLLELEKRYSKQEL